MVIHMTVLLALLKGIPSRFKKFKWVADRAVDYIERQNREIKELRSQLVSGFYEDKIPSFTQGAPVHELQEIITAEEVTGYISTIVELRSQIASVDFWRDSNKRQADSLYTLNSALNTKCVNLEAALLETEKKWIAEQANALKAEAALEIQSQELQHANSLLVLDSGVIEGLRRDLAVAQAKFIAYRRNLA